VNEKTNSPQQLQPARQSLDTHFDNAFADWLGAESAVG
jgi:hypothetical protein